jgi:hypothetical protein
MPSVELVLQIRRKSPREVRASGGVTRRGVGSLGRFHGTTALGCLRCRHDPRLTRSGRLGGRTRRAEMDRPSGVRGAGHVGGLHREGPLRVADMDTGSRLDRGASGPLGRPRRHPFSLGLLSLRAEAPERARADRRLRGRARCIVARASSRHGPGGRYRRFRHARLRERPAVTSTTVARSASATPTRTLRGGIDPLSRRARAAASTATASTPPSAPGRACRSRGRSKPPGATNPTTPRRCSTRYALAASRL